MPKAGITRNGMSYAAAMSACGRATPPQPLAALRLVNEAVAAGVVLGVQGFNAAISACAAAAESDKALQLIEVGR